VVETVEEPRVEEVVEAPKEPVAEEVVSQEQPVDMSKAAYDEAFEKGRIAGLQEAIIARMEKNGFVTDQMRNDVYNQTHIQSLINWVKSF
jgi:predicted RND superfamily exporter protein